MGLWADLANWCLPAGTFNWGTLDGYLPPAPAGHRWVRRSSGLRIVPRAAAVGERWPTGEWELRPSLRPRTPSRRPRV